MPSDLFQGKARSISHALRCTAGGDRERSGPETGKYRGGVKTKKGRPAVGGVHLLHAK